MPRPSVQRPQQTPPPVPPRRMLTVQNTQQRHPGPACVFIGRSDWPCWRQSWPARWAGMRRGGWAPILPCGYRVTRRGDTQTHLHTTPERPHAQCLHEQVAHGLPGDPCVRADARLTGHPAPADPPPGNSRRHQGRPRRCGAHCRSAGLCLPPMHPGPRLLDTQALSVAAGPGTGQSHHARRSCGACSATLSRVAENPRPRIRHRT